MQCIMSTSKIKHEFPYLGFLLLQAIDLLRWDEKTQKHWFIIIIIINNNNNNNNSVFLCFFPSHHLLSSLLLHIKMK